MIQATTLSAPLGSSRFFLTPAAEAKLPVSATPSGDTVTISQEALAKSRELTAPSDKADQPEGEVAPSLWETRYGLKAGETFLSNGHKRKTILDGDDMQILEYDGSRLLRKETGTLSQGNVAKTIEEYDQTGQLTRRVRSELYAASSSEAKNTRSTLRRDIEWFKNGTVSKELHDSMDVDALYKGEAFLNGEDVITPDGVEKLVQYMTKDFLSTNYVANILEYGDTGKLFRSTRVSQSVQTKNQTNRGNAMQDGLRPNTTVELAKATDLSIDQATFDSEGNIASQVSFSDSSIKGVSQSQRLDVSVYKDGKLVQNSKAEAIQRQTKDHSLRERPTIFETLGLTQRQYSASTPLDARELLDAGHAQHVDDAATFLDPTLEDVSKGVFNPAGDMSLDAAGSVPHSITWESTLYQNGKPTARQQHAESVRETPVPSTSGFRTRTGLTEDKEPAYLRETSHSVETYQDGAVRDHSAVAMRETPVDDARGITHTQTDVATSSGSRGMERTTHHAVADTVAGLDKDWTAASRNVERSIQTLLDDFVAAFQSEAAA